jgi:hypothetical protein
MRAIFLDFDGVLSPADGNTAVLPFVWLPILEQLLAPWPEVMLAVHSTWRYLYKPEELRELLGFLGPRFIGAAPRGPRAEAILWFLQLNPVIDSYLVLDDAPSEFPAGFPGPIVFCESLRGISAPQVQAQIEAWLAEDFPPLETWLAGFAIRPAVRKEREPDGWVSESGGAVWLGTLFSSQMSTANAFSDEEAAFAGFSNEVAAPARSVACAVHARRTSQNVCPHIAQRFDWPARQCFEGSTPPSVSRLVRRPWVFRGSLHV